VEVMLKVADVVGGVLPLGSDGFSGCSFTFVGLAGDLGVLWHCDLRNVGGLAKNPGYHVLLAHSPGVWSASWRRKRSEADWRTARQGVRAS
jgi:hypothetical protein